MTKHKSLIDSETEDFYSNTSEDDRLKFGLGPLEFERNQELITRFLPAQGSLIADIGGGPGIYSQWLSSMGYKLVLVDPVQKHIDLANQKIAKHKLNFECVLGEARNLPFADNSFDLVLLHGPLYHLLKPEERQEALTEAKRILKPGGVILAWAINYSASTLVGLLQGLIHDPKFFAMCTQELGSGNHIAPAGMAGSFPRAYYHSYQKLESEIKLAGYTDIQIFAVEGIIWLDSKYFETRGNAGQKSRMLELLRTTESSKDLLGLSPHLMIAAKK